MAAVGERAGDADGAHGVEAVGVLDDGQFAGGRRVVFTEGFAEGDVFDHEHDTGGCFGGEMVLFEEVTGDGIVVLIGVDDFSVSDIVKDGSQVNDEWIGFFGFVDEAGIFSDAFDVPPIVTCGVMAEASAHEGRGLSDDIELMHVRGCGKPVLGFSLRMGSADRTGVDAGPPGLMSRSNSKGCMARLCIGGRGASSARIYKIDEFNC